MLSSQISAVRDCRELHGARLQSDYSLDPQFRMPTKKTLFILYFLDIEKFHFDFCI